MKSLLIPDQETAAVAPPRAALWQRYRKRHADPSVENELIQEYLTLVRRIVGRLARKLPAHVDIEDLYSAAMVGLLNALRQFDPKMGVAFEGYASFRIRGAVLDELRSTDWAPRSVRARIRNVKAVQWEFEQKNRRLPSDEEIAQALNMPLHKYREVQDQIQSVRFVSLNAMQRNLDGLEWKETIADPRQHLPSDEVERRQLVNVIRHLDLLSEKQRRVLELRYFESLPCREIARALKLSEARIAQIHSTAILAIRSFFKLDGPCTNEAAYDLKKTTNRHQRRRAFVNTDQKTPVRRHSELAKKRINGFSGSPASIQEISFVSDIRLPTDTTNSASVTGPWHALLGRFAG